jgi:AraC-like DNA-binding protein
MTETEDWMTQSMACLAPEAHGDVPGRPWPGLVGMLLLDGRRVLYRGHVAVATTDRRFGGHLGYVSLGGAFEIRMDAGGWRSAHMAVLMPHQLHALRVDRQPIVQVLIEPDDVDLSDLPAWLRSDGIDPLPAAAFAALQARLTSLKPCLVSEVAWQVDMALCGRPLRPRPLDPRVRSVLQHMGAEPGEPHTAQHCAALAGLSVSRFLHLFSAEVGVPFRRLRTWKRVRTIAAEMSRGDQRLTTVAITGGYADAAHFSRSIREAFGLRPSDMLSHNRPAHVVF